MYKPVQPIRCPKCGTTVNVNTSMILTSNPPCYAWTCPNCGEKGYIKQGDIITFENQTIPATSGYIQKVGEPDPGVGVTTTNADDIKTIDITPAISATNTRCIICDEEFKFDGEHRICPKCREDVMKVRKNIYDAQHNIGSYGCTVYRNPTPAAKSTVTDPKSTACNIPAPQFLQQGWQCPKCGAILAPNQTYCPFCSPSEYGRTNWIGTGYGEWANRDNLTPSSGQYTNPNPSTTISLGDKPKVPNSYTVTYTIPCDNIKATDIEMWWD